MTNLLDWTIWFSVWTYRFILWLYHRAETKLVDVLVTMMGWWITRSHVMYWIMNVQYKSFFNSWILFVSSWKFLLCIVFDLFSDSIEDDYFDELYDVAGRGGDIVQSVTRAWKVLVARHILAQIEINHAKRSFRWECRGVYNTRKGMGMFILMSFMM